LCLQVSRSIGDAYLKKAEFNREPLPLKFRLPETFFKPILSSEPSISVHKIQPEDQFLIFASDGLWEHLSSQTAVNIVSNSPRNVSLHSVNSQRYFLIQEYFYDTYRFM
jgi:pyruvate dehydrogenase phosphatase